MKLSDLKLNGLVYLAVAVLIILAGVIGWQACKALNKPADNSANVSLISSLQDSVKTAKADLKAAGDMIATLRATGQLKDGKLKVSAATIADLTARLGKVSGGGPAKPGDGDWSVFQDQYLTVFFRQTPDSLTYSLFERPIKISIIEGLNNDWQGYARDCLADAPIPIDTLDIQRNKDWTPPKPWYKKLKNGVLVVGGVAVAGGLGYMAGRIF